MKFDSVLVTSRYICYLSSHNFFLNNTTCKICTCVCARTFAYMPFKFEYFRNVIL